jgi:hypothetical protein
MQMTGNNHFGVGGAYGGGARANSLNRGGASGAASNHTKMKPPRRERSMNHRHAENAQIDPSQYKEFVGDLKLNITSLKGNKNKPQQ